MVKNILLRVLASVLIVVGYGVMVLPYAIDQYSRIRQQVTITGYQNTMDSLGEQQIQEAFKKSAEYNKKIAQQQAEQPYVYEGTNPDDEEYYSLPVSDTISGEVCTVVIDKINVNLPVGHGTEDEELLKMAGHLYGTSLPTGDSTNDGKTPPSYGTHAVIAAHTALRESEMFSRLDELKVGDEIEIHVLGKKHIYEVEQMEIMLPEYANDYIQIEPGRDLITLYTCTPYGVNSHRLLVKAHRVEDRKEEASEAMDFNNTTFEPIFKLAGLGIIPIVLVIFINKKMS